MSTGRQERGALWRTLIDKGWEPDEPYISYSIAKLREVAEQFSGGDEDILAEIDAEVQEIVEAAVEKVVEDTSRTEVGKTTINPDLPQFTAEGFSSIKADTTGTRATTPRPQRVNERRPALKHEIPTEEEDVFDAEEPLRIDEDGRIWFREEIGPNVAKNRRLRKRVTQVVPDSVEVKQVKSGDYIETVEVIGEGRRNLDAFVTLPPTQTGIYKDPRFPFLIFTYNGSDGFSHGDVDDFYGGREFVPKEIKRKFVGNMMAYDIRDTISAINREHRELMLSRSLPNMR